MANRAGLTALQQQLLAYVTAAADPISTTALRNTLNADLAEHLVTEHIYRRLLALERRGLIMRTKEEPGRRDTCWRPVPPRRRATG